MSQAPRRVRLKAFAKINLDLRVLHRRPDGYHEIRTIFQTISLADVLDLEFDPGQKPEVLLKGSSDIPDNLVVRAANLLLERSRIRGRVVMRLWKKIPMGAGLGGGSSDAAAILLALPVLAGVQPDCRHLLEWAEELGSDVPFFLMGGTAVGGGRGEELYPLPDPLATHGLLITPNVHVSTAEAYANLKRGEGPGRHDASLKEFLSVAWNVCGAADAPDWREIAANDFEPVAFQMHPALRSWKRKLRELGAKPSLMTGSGSAIFGLFESRQQLEAARRSLANAPAVPFTFVNRARYRALWKRQLEHHTQGDLWPPRGRYA